MRGRVLVPAIRGRVRGYGTWLLPFWYIGTLRAFGTIECFSFPCAMVLIISLQFGVCVPFHCVTFHREIDARKTHSRAAHTALSRVCFQVRAPRARVLLACACTHRVRVRCLLLSIVRLTRERHTVVQHTLLSRVCASRCVRRARACSPLARARTACACAACCFPS